MLEKELTIFDCSATEIVIEQIETGQGVDRDIDLHVVNLFAVPPYRWSELSAEIGGKKEIAVREFPETIPGEITIELLNRDEYLPIIVPKFTTTLDATKMLIETRLPGKRKVTLEFKTDGNSYAEIGWRPQGARSPEWIWTQGIGATPEKALLAAFLRAIIRR